VKKIVLVFLSVVCFCQIFDYNAIITDVKFATLNRIRPGSFKYLAEVKKNPKDVDVGKLHKYKFYYKKVSDYMPERIDAISMMGYCAYHLGEEEEAIAFYKEAISINSYFFWLHYNLGVIYYNNKDYELAKVSFEKALAVNPEGTLVMTLLSKRIYHYNLTVQGFRAKEMIVDHLAKGYKTCQIYLLLCCNFLGDYQNMQRISALSLQMNKQEDSRLNYFLGLSFYKARDYQKAMFFLKKSMADEEIPEVFDYFGRSLKATGSNSMAVLFLGKAAQLYKEKESLESKYRYLELEVF